MLNCATADAENRSYTVLCGCNAKFSAYYTFTTKTAVLQQPKCPLGLR